MPLRASNVIKAPSSHPRRCFTISAVVAHPLSRSPYSTPPWESQPSERQLRSSNFRQAAMPEGSFQMHKPGPLSVIIPALPSDVLSALILLLEVFMLSGWRSTGNCN